MSEDNSNNPLADPLSGPPELAYALPIVGGGRPVLILLAGLFTSALTLLALYVAGRIGGPNVMGWHLYYIVPVGAVIIGAIAASGYGMASSRTGLRIGRWLPWIIFAIQIVVYFAAQYVEFWNLHLVYRDTGARVGFGAYLYATASSYGLTDSAGHRTALGEAGVLLCAVDILAFAAGSFIVTAGMIGKPYCHVCQTYMKNRQLVCFPASSPYRKINPKDAKAVAAYEEEQAMAVKAAVDAAELLVSLAVAGDVATVREVLAGMEPEQKEIEKLPCRVELDLDYCEHCITGTLQTVLLVGAHSSSLRRPLSETVLKGSMISGLLAARLYAH